MRLENALAAGELPYAADCDMLGFSPAERPIGRS
jgi:hypothetical protein